MEGMEAVGEKGGDYCHSNAFLELCDAVSLLVLRHLVWIIYVNTHVEESSFPMAMVILVGRIGNLSSYYGHESALLVLRTCHINYDYHQQGLMTSYAIVYYVLGAYMKKHPFLHGFFSLH